MSKYERQLKKDLKTKLPDPNPQDDLYERVTQENAINVVSPKRTNKRLVSLLALSFCLVIALVIGTVALINLNGKKVAKNYSIVQLDTNPSIEMVVDENNKVVSLRGLNDEGKMIICDEELQNLDLDQAIKEIIRIETELGYLVVGSSENEITITISAETSKIEESLHALANDAVNTFKETLNVTVEEVKGYTLEELRALVKDLDKTYTDEQIEKMDYSALVNVIRLYHLDVVSFASVELEKMYQNFKNNEIRFTELEAIKDATKTLDSIYQLLIEQYNFAYDALSDAYNKMQDAYYQNFINPDSDYQQELQVFYTYKENYLKEKVRLNKVIDDENVTVLEKEASRLALQKLEVEYNIKKAALESKKIIADEIYQNVETLFTTTLTTMESIKAQLPKEIATITFNTLKDTEAKINEYKTSLLNKFEEKYQTEIDKFKNDLLARKEELKTAISDGLNDNVSLE